MESGLIGARGGYLMLLSGPEGFPSLQPPGEASQPASQPASQAKQPVSRHGSTTTNGL